MKQKSKEKERVINDIIIGSKREVKRNHKKHNQIFYVLKN